MGTKNNPGKFDCYAKAHADEEMFVLLGRDAMGGGLVRLWTYLRNKDWASAVVEFAKLVAAARTLPETDHEKSEEALRCAENMDFWFLRRRLPQVAYSERRQ